MKIDADKIAREQGPDGLAAELDRMLTKTKSETGSTNTTNTTNAAEDWPAPLPFEAYGDLPLFPVHALNGWVGEMVAAVATGTQTPADLAGGLALAILGACGAGKLNIAVNSGWSEPTNLYTVTALPPACRKSSVFSTMTMPMLEWELTESERLRPEIIKASAEADILVQRHKDAKARAAKAIDSSERTALTKEAQSLAEELQNIKIPPAPRLICDDVTPEALGRLLHDHDGRMAVLSAEGDIFDIMAGRYNEGTNIGVFLKGHAGDSLRVNRVGRPTDHVEKPALTVGLCVQPDVIENLSQKRGFRGRGLLGRILYSVPRNPLGHREIDSPPIPLDVQMTYHRNMLALLSLPWGRDSNGRPCAYSLRLSSEAKDIIRAFQARLEPKLADGGELDGLTDWAGKLAGAVVRIAGGLHLAAELVDPWTTPISGATMVAAITLGDYYTEHAKAAFCLMGADPHVEIAKRIVSWIRRNAVAHFTRRDIQQSLRFKASDLCAPLGLLIDHDYIRPVLTCRTGPGRKPNGPFAFDVNPHCRGQ